MGEGVLAKYELEKVWLVYQSMRVQCNARGRLESRRARQLHEHPSTRAQNWASRRGAFTFKQEKMKRFASSGVSGHSKSGRTQTKLNGRGGMSFGPLRRDRRAVRVFTFTSCDCLQPPVRKVLAFMLCWLTDVRHSPSEPPAKRTLTDGDRRERVQSAIATRCAWLLWTAFPTKNSSLSIISYEKASQVFEEKELDKHSAVRSCQAGGGGEGEWSRRVALHEACMGVHVLCTGTRIHWDANQTFFCTKVRGRGESNQILREYGFKKNFENYGRPLTRCAFLQTLAPNSCRSLYPGDELNRSSHLKLMTVCSPYQVLPQNELCHN